MKIIRMLFYIILNVLISAGTIWLVYTFLIERNEGINGQSGSVIGFNQPINNDQIPATVVPDKLIVDSIISSGNIEYERVTLIHVGGEDLLISGWKLYDQDGETYIFPSLNLYPGSSITIYSKAGNDSVTDLYWGSEEPIWESGEVITLADPAGYPQAMYVVP